MAAIQGGVSASSSELGGIGNWAFCLGDDQDDPDGLFDGNVENYKDVHSNMSRTWSSSAETLSQTKSDEGFMSKAIQRTSKLRRSLTSRTDIFRRKFDERRMSLLVGGKERVEQRGHKKDRLKENRVIYSSVLKNYNLVMPREQSVLSICDEGDE